MNIEKALELADCHRSDDWADAMVATLARRYGGCNHYC